MTRMNRFPGLLMALALAAFALPAVAADKLFLVKATVYTLSGDTPTSIGNNIPQGPTPSILLLEYENQSPNGANSVIKSIDAHVPVDVTYKFAGSKTLNVSNATPDVSCAPPPSSYFSVVPTTTGGVYSQNSITGVKPRGSFCLYLAVTTSSTSCSAVSWRTDANTGNSITGGQEFYDYNIPTQPYSLTSTTNGCTGVLGCDSNSNVAGVLGPLVTQDVAYIGDPDWGLVRSETNKDGLACTAAVPFNFVFAPTATPQSATFTIPPNNLNQAVAVKYVVLWTPVPVDGVAAGATAGWSTTPSGRVQVAWLKNGDAWVYVPALRCVSDTMGLPVDTLPVIPAVQPFIGLAGTYPGYGPGELALMCVAQQGSTSVGRALPPSPPTLQPILLQYWHMIIDYADGATQLTE